MRFYLKRLISLFISVVIIVIIGRIVFDNRNQGEVVELEFSRKDNSWLQNVVTSRSDEIPTVVVEEHYEVLNYWFQAAELDLIPKSKNVLIHIDGHVDGAIPIDVDALPWFRFPRDNDEIYRMMQRNDMFIVAAAVTGFIDHVIWVWPTWDESNHDDEDWTQLRFNVKIGISSTDSNGTFSTKSFLCFCWTQVNINTNTNDDEWWDCHVRDTDCVEGSKCSKIPRDRCLIQSQAVLEIVSESVANAVLAKEKWPQDKGFILDIDEDFFGCWSDVVPLYESGVTQKNINVVTDVVADLFCVSTAEREALVDRVYTACISLVKSLKFRSCVNQEETKQQVGCLSIVDIENYVIQNSDDIISYFKSKLSKNIFCDVGEKIESLLFQSLLLHFVLNFSIEQLILLEQLGICLGVSPVSPNFPMDGKFHVCHGDNIPNRTLVPFHLPTESEISSRAIKLQQILSSVVKKPDLITVCRSVRDGYTPKSFSHLIESSLMDSISKSYRKVNVSRVYYDSNLLGGKEGWHGRSQPLIQYLLHFLRYNEQRLI